MEEKYKKAMVQNAQLDNEKTTIHYEVLYNSATFFSIRISIGFNGYTVYHIPNPCELITTTSDYIRNTL